MPGKPRNLAYQLDSTGEARRLYAEWAASDDDEIAAKRYATPAR